MVKITSSQSPPTTLTHAALHRKSPISLGWRRRHAPSPTEALPTLAALQRRGTCQSCRHPKLGNGPRIGTCQLWKRCNARERANLGARCACSSDEAALRCHTPYKPLHRFGAYRARNLLAHINPGLQRLQRGRDTGAAHAMRTCLPCMNGSTLFLDIPSHSMAHVAGH
jgi:hypothetical protein